MYHYVDTCIVFQDIHLGGKYRRLVDWGSMGYIPAGSDWDLMACLILLYDLRIRATRFYYLIFLPCDLARENMHGKLWSAGGLLKLILSTTSDIGHRPIPSGNILLFF